MKNCFLCLFLGHFAAVHSIPVYTVTQIPEKHEGDIFQEVERDGFLVDHFLHTSTIPSPNPMSVMDRVFSSPETELHKIFTIVQASESIEGSGGSEESPSISPSVSHTSTPATSTTISTTVQASENKEGSGGSEESSFVSRTSIPASSQISGIFASSKTEPATISTTVQASENEEGESGEFPSISPSVSHTSTPATSTTISTTVQASENEEGSGEGGEFPSISPSVSHTSTPATSTTISTTVQASENKESSSDESEESPSGDLKISHPSTSIAGRAGRGRIFFPSMDISEKFVEVKTEEPSLHKGHSTPDWLIIVGILVGLISLVAVCAAIATREKWNGPKQTSISSDQKREVETQTFLQNYEPKENGKEAEYTVIPLDELPEGYSSD